MERGLALFSRFRLFSRKLSAQKSILLAGYYMIFDETRLKALVLDFFFSYKAYYWDAQKLTHLYAYFILF